MLCSVAVCLQLLVLYLLGSLAGSCTHLAYCWYDAGGEHQYCRLAALNHTA